MLKWILAISEHTLLTLPIICFIQIYFPVYLSILRLHSSKLWYPFKIVNAPKKIQDVKSLETLT